MSDAGGKRDEMSKMKELNLQMVIEVVEELHMTEMTSLKKRMTKKGSCRSPEASSTEHMFLAISGYQCDVERGRGCM